MHPDQNVLDGELLDRLASVSAAGTTTSELSIAMTGWARRNDTITQYGELNAAGYWEIPGGQVGTALRRLARNDQRVVYRAERKRWFWQPTLDAEVARGYAAAEQAERVRVMDRTNWPNEQAGALIVLDDVVVVTLRTKYEREAHEPDVELLDPKFALELADEIARRVRVRIVQDALLQGVLA